jgi:WD40 repeat protein
VRGWQRPAERLLLAGNRKEERLLTMRAQSQCVLALVGLCLAGGLPLAAQEARPAGAAVAKITYDEHVRPIFREHCFACHSADKQESGLALDSYAKTMAGGSSGEVVLPGDLASSRLWALVSHAEEPKMPPRQDRLADAKLELIRKWIEQGAPENAGSRVVVKKNPLAVASTAEIGKPQGPPAMPQGVPRQPMVYTPRPGQTTALAASPWAPLIALAGHKQVLLYHQESGELLGVLPFPEGVPQIIRFSRNGSVLLVGGGRGGHSGCVVLYDVATGRRLAKLGDELDAVLAADLHPTQTLVALGGPQRVVRIYSVQTGELVHEIRKHTDWIYGIEFSPDGKLLATCDRSAGLFVWEAQTAREVLNLRGHSGAIFDVTWRLDSGLLASGGEDNTIKFWELNDGKVLKSFNAHAGGVFCLRFAQDGRLVSAGRDNTVRVWTADGSALKAMPAFPEPALRCAFAHDGKAVVGGDWAGHVTLWNVADAKPLASFASNPPTLQMRVAAAEEALKQRQAAAAAAQQALAEVQASLARTDQALAAAQGVLTSLGGGQKALKEAIQQLPTAGMDPKTADPAAKALSEAEAAAKATVESLAKKKNELAANLAEKQRAAEQAAASVAQAAQQLDAAKAELTAFTALREKLAAAARQAQEKLEAATAAVNGLQPQVAAASDRSQQLAERAKSLQEQIAALQAELQKVLAEQKSAEQAAAQTSKALAEAEAALEKVQQEAATALADYEAFSAAYGAP